jgi:AcrR family transcriptional regulator
MTPKEHIMQVAEELFFRKGYHSTTTREIARQANINVSMINYYYQSKEDFYIAFFEKLERVLDATVFIEAKNYKRADSLRRFILATSSVLRSEPRLVHLFLVEKMQPSSEKIKLITDSIYQKHFNIFSDHLNSKHESFMLISNTTRLMIYHSIFSIIKNLDLRAGFQPEIGTESTMDEEKSLNQLASIFLKSIVAVSK